MFKKILASIMVTGVLLGGIAASACTDRSNGVYEYAGWSNDTHQYCFICYNSWCDDPYTIIRTDPCTYEWQYSTETPNIEQEICIYCKHVRAERTAESITESNLTSVIWNMNTTSLSYWISSSYDYDSYLISSSFSDESAVVECNDSWGNLTANYTLNGELLGNNPLYFNFITGCQNANGDIVAEKEIRSQYFMYGDVNCNGIIDVNDVNALSSFIDSDANTSDNPLYYNESLTYMLDYNGDCIIDYNDVELLIAYIEEHNPVTNREFGSMSWATIDSQVADILGLGNVGEMDLIIVNGSNGDVTFNLYAV